MAETFAIHESNGTAETTSVASNINYGSTDSANLTPASYPITASENSYEKWERCYWSGTFNKIENLQIWKSAGSYVTGESIDTNLTTTGYSQDSYATPTDSTSTVADIVMPTADPAAANMGIAGSLTGNLSSAGYSDYWVTQLQTTATTPPGDVNQKTFTIQYDES